MSTRDRQVKTVCSLMNQVGYLKRLSMLKLAIALVKLYFTQQNLR